MNPEQFAISVRSLLDDHMQNHSPIQMNYFITGMHGITDYGCYKQALREVEKRFRGVRSELLQMKLAENELARLNHKAVGDFKDEFEQTECKIKALEQASALEDMKRSVRDTTRELTHFVAQAQHYRGKLSNGEAGWKLADHVDELQWGFWAAMIQYRGSLDVIAGGGQPSRATFELACSFPKDRRKELLRKLRDPGLISYAENMAGDELKLSMQPLPAPEAVMEAIACH